MHMNVIKQMEQNSLKKDIENTIKWKQKKAKEVKRIDKKWDEEYLTKIYKDKPGSILDYFFLNRENRGYE